MKNDEEMFRSVISRRDKYRRNRSGLKRILTFAVPAAVCLCITAVVGAHLHKGLNEIPGLPPGQEIAAEQPTDTAVTALATDKVSKDTETKTEVTAYDEESTEAAEKNTSEEKPASATEATDSSAVQEASAADNKPVSEKADQAEHGTTAAARTEKAGKTTASARNTEPAARTTEAPKATAPKQPEVIYSRTGADAEDAAMIGWNGITVSYSLYEVLKEQNGSDTLIAVSPSFETDENYVYNGKTIAQHMKDYDEGWVRSQMMQSLIKEGEYLKYGEALYTTGAPDGEKWSKQWYDERVAQYGELLDKYIVNGEFLRDKLEADLAADNSASPANYISACRAYQQYMANETARKLESLGIPYELRGGREPLVIFVTAEELRNDPAEKVSVYSLAAQQYADDETAAEAAGYSSYDD
ncbi:MAG: hypothetical protein J5501_00435 [Ruminococcus sp.]|nr:hypothetical protein [Ruminococcus sp.]